MTHPIFTEEHDLIRAQLRRFIDEKVKPEGAKWEEAGFIPREVLREMGELGFFSLRVPEALGGAGLDARASVLLAEEVGRSTFGGVSITVLVHTDMASPHLIRFGNKRQLEKYLPGVMAGTTITGVGVTEPGTGSDVTAIRTRAVKDGDHYVLNGAKMFITNGVHGDLFFIAARTDPEAKGSRAITMFIVEKGTPGFRVGRALDKTGWLCSDTAELVFEDCRVPAENVLGERGAGFAIAQDRLGPGRIHHCMRAIGSAERAFELMCRRAHDRQAFGGPLAEKQFVQDFIATSRMEIDQARLMVLHAAWRMDTEGKRAARQDISMIKVIAAQMHQRVLDRAMQVHGALGMSDDTPLAAAWRQGRWLRIADGPDEVHKMVIALRELNRFKPREPVEA
jgi:acyl-CoA dehydrogenase